MLTKHVKIMRVEREDEYTHLVFLRLRITWRWRGVLVWVKRQRIWVGLTALNSEQEMRDALRDNGVLPPKAKPQEAVGTQWEGWQWQSDEAQDVADALRPPK